MKTFKFLHNSRLPVCGAWRAVFSIVLRARSWLWQPTCAIGARCFVPGVTPGSWSRALAHGAVAVLLLGLSSAAGAVSQPELRFATKPFAPYTYADANGRAAGPMVDLLLAACAKLQWRCTVEVLPWRRAWGMAERGQVDGVFPIVDSPARRAAFQLSPPVVTGRYVLMGQAGAAPACRQAHCDLTGRMVAVYGPSDAATSLEQLVDGVPGVRAELEIDQETVLRKLAHGRYGADGLALVNEAVAQRQRASDGLANLRTQAVLKNLAYANALAPRDGVAGRAADFSAAIAAMCRNGQVAALFQRHGLASTAACRRLAP